MRVVLLRTTRWRDEEGGVRADLLRRAAAELGLDDLVDDGREEDAVLLHVGLVAAGGDDGVVVGEGGFVRCLSAGGTQSDRRAALQQQSKNTAMTQIERAAIRAFSYVNVRICSGCEEDCRLPNRDVASRTNSREIQRRELNTPRPALTLV